MPDVDDAAPRGNGLSTAALVCGIIGLLIFPLGIAAVILGIIALNKGQEKGKAIAGIVLGGLWLVFVPFIAIVAAIAIPNLLESRVTANEAATKAALKSGIFPAEVQFQAGAYRDGDGDSLGEYGELADLGGPGAKAQLLQGPVTTGTANGYRFAIHVPDDAKLAARHWIAYAWPQDSNGGRHVFCITEDGQVRVSPQVVRSPADCVEPEWNAAIGDWGGKAAWPVAARGYDTSNR